MTSVPADECVESASVCTRTSELVFPNPVVVVEMVDRYSLLILGFGGWTNFVRARAGPHVSLYDLTSRR